MLVLILSIIFSCCGAKEKVIFGGTELFPWHTFKDKDAGNGASQIMTNIIFENSKFSPLWIEQTNIRQKKELSKDILFCRTTGEARDPFKIIRKKSGIEEYIDNDLKKVKFKILESTPFHVNLFTGFIAINKNNLGKFNKYAQSNKNGYPIIDGFKITDQLELKTGINPGAVMQPYLLVNAGINKKIKMLETVMDYEYNFFRMVESGRIDFYYDSLGVFAPDTRKKANIELLKKHPELKAIISLRVPEFDFFAVGKIACSAKSSEVIDVINKKLKSIFTSESAYNDFILKIFSKILTKDAIDLLISESFGPGYRFFKAIQEGKDEEYLKNMQDQILKNNHLKPSS